MPPFLSCPEFVYLGIASGRPQTKGMRAEITQSFRAGGAVGRPRIEPSLDFEKLPGLGCLLFVAKQ